MEPAVAGRRALAGPEEGLIDLLLWDVARLNFSYDRVDERDFGFEPGLQANDQSIAEGDWPVRLGRRDVDFLDFIGGRGALNNSTANCRSQDNRRKREQSDEAHRTGRNEC